MDISKSPCALLNALNNTIIPGVGGGVSRRHITVKASVHAARVDQTIIQS